METQIMQETNCTEALIYVSLGYFIMDGRVSGFL